LCTEMPCASISKANFKKSRRLKKMLRITVTSMNPKNETVLQTECTK
jgi:hypothetical protein